MKVLSVFIFTCLLFQTASLQKKKHAPEEQRTDLNLEQIRDGLHDKKIPVSEENTRDTLLEEISKQVSALEPRPPKLEPDTQAKPDSTPKTPQGPDEHFLVPPEQESKQIESAPDLRPPKLKPDTPAKPDSTPKTPQGPDEHFLVPPEQESKQIESAPDLRPPKLKPDTPAKPDSTPKPKVPDEHFLSPQCLNQNYTWFSCSKVFCPPWRRCIGGQCVCKMPYKCPRQQINACTLDGSVYYSMCQANAISCRTKKPIFSHFSQTCKAEDNVKVTLMNSGAHKVVEIKTKLGKKLVCGKDWNMAIANVVCRNSLKVDRGAEKASKITYVSLDKTITWPNECMRVHCTGYELSLAECTIYKPEPIAGNAEVAVAKCYEEPKGKCNKFICANGKCLLHGKPCNGVDDCGDNSDEMCCQSCHDSGFHCKSGVCIPRHAVRDGIRDCLGGEDELEAVPVHPTPPTPPKTRPTPGPGPCRTDQAICRNGQCISRGYVCDGKTHCADGSDEFNCGTPSPCEPNEFKCQNGRCSLKLWRCDGDNDCQDNSDEMNCPTKGPGDTCAPEMFVCLSDRTCIPLSYQCDEEPDCADCSDEYGCAPPTVTISPEESIVAAQGDTVTFTCSAIGVPVPLISWRFNWGHIPANSRITMTSQNGRGTLTIRDFKEGDQGVYTCEAMNSKGLVFAIPDGNLSLSQRPNPVVSSSLYALAEIDKAVVKKVEELFSDPMSEIREIRSSAERQLQCGVPNKGNVYGQEGPRSRRKRLAGWKETLPTQIQWQVAIQDEGLIHCGGAYLGGCWVLTAAHCVRPKPKSFRIKLSLWRKHRKQSTTESIPVKNIIIHNEYNPQTHANDIALVQLETLPLSDKCVQDNPAVRTVGVPWSTQQFQPNDTCTISGWGKEATLKWANMTLIGNCENYYKDRFLPGMECAGDLEGKVDWIRFHTGWPAVTKYNQ
ncbi:complement factor I isoform X4 [Labeo rohita]|uniref:complement factor I isoform X4 n=1 Tax=Labeo rohita TaxID=84645 RepID=UPI0021E31869|nr:complement factor I isoform X4 [Labeo rohita]